MVGTHDKIHIKYIYLTETTINCLLSQKRCYPMTIPRSRSKNKKQIRLNSMASTIMHLNKQVPMITDFLYFRLLVLAFFNFSILKNVYHNVLLSEFAWLFKI